MWDLASVEMFHILKRVLCLPIAELCMDSEHTIPVVVTSASWCTFGGVVVCVKLRVRRRSRRERFDWSKKILHWTTIVSPSSGTSTIPIDWTIPKRPLTNILRDSLALELAPKVTKITTPSSVHLYRQRSMETQAHSLEIVGPSVVPWGPVSPLWCDPLVVRAVVSMFLNGHTVIAYRSWS